jgi:hypothetical protein
VAPDLYIGQGIAAPKIALPDTFEAIDGRELYVILPKKE